MKKKWFYLIIVFLIVASFAAFGRIMGNDFINFDDDLYITENAHVQSGFNLKNIKWVFTAIVVGNWHPLTLLSHMLDWSLFGNNATGHHLVSLFLHIGSAILLFLFLYKTTNHLWPSAFAAAFFALHPLRVESVAWAAERKDVLSMFFATAALYTYAFYAENRKISQYLLCLFLFALALMSKPMMVTLPFVLLLLDYWPLNRLDSLSTANNDLLKKAGRLLSEKIPFFMLTIAVSAIAFQTHSPGSPVHSENFTPVFTRCANAVVSYAIYLAKTFWPANLAVYYPYNLYFSFGKIVSSVAIILFITVCVLYQFKKRPFLFVGWFWYLGTLIPVIGLIQVGSQAMADRYTYLPSIGIAVMLSWGIPLFFPRAEIRKKILFPAGTVFIIFLMMLTWRQCGFWENSMTLFSHALKITTNNYIAHNHLASALIKNNRFNQAMHHYNEAIRINPLYAHAYLNRGIAHYAFGNKQSALSDFREAIRHIPQTTEFAAAYNNLGATYTDLGQYPSAIASYNQAIHLKPNYADAYNNRAYVYFQLNNLKQGCFDAHKACELGNCNILQSAQSKNACTDE